MSQLWGTCPYSSSEGLGVVGFLPGPHGERQGIEPGVGGFPGTYKTLAPSLALR